MQARGEPFMPLLENELARRENGRIHLRPQPLRVRWSLSGLVTADGHDVRCQFSCSVRGLPDDLERRMLGEVLLHDRPAAAERDVAEHFLPALRSAATKVAEATKGAELLDEAGRAKLIDALKAAAQPVAFACGVEVLPPFSVDVESPSLQEQRLRAMQRSVAEQQAAGQLEHFQRAAELLKQFQSLRQGAPDLSAGHVLQQVSPTDRGAMLQTLLLAASKEAGGRVLLAVAGPYLVRIDVPEDSSSPKTQLTPLPPTLGPLRSVQGADMDGRRMVLVGARSGFLLVGRDSPDEPTAYADPGIDSQLGFSGVVYLPESDQFCGCHGDGGIVFWQRGKPDAPVRVVRTRELTGGTGAPPPPLPSSGSAAVRAASPRNVQAIDGRSVLFSLGASLMVLSPDGSPTPLAPQSHAEIAAILPGGPRLYAVHEDGTVCVIDRATQQITCTEHRGVRVNAAGTLPWIGGERLLLAGEEGPIYCAGFDDPLVTQYVSPHRGPRVVAGSHRHVAAVSADRQRLILWNSWDGRKPVTEVYLAGVARHRIADVDFV